MKNKLLLLVLSISLNAISGSSYAQKMAKIEYQPAALIAGEIPNASLYPKIKYKRIICCSTPSAPSLPTYVIQKKTTILSGLSAEFEQDWYSPYPQETIKYFSKPPGHILYTRHFQVYESY